jgi:hypothetical protein
MHRLLRLVLTLSLLAGTRTFPHAQTAAYAEIQRIDTENFPQISALVDVYDANGEFISGLQPEDFTYYEDEKQGQVDTVSESEPPVQVVVAVNPGSPMGIRDGNGIPRFERVITMLSQWADAQPVESMDDLSLVSLSGSLITHANVKDWAVSLNSFKPDLRNSVPNLQTLAIALDTVNAATPEPGMKRAVLFITPHMNDPEIESALAPLIQRAVDSKVRVSVWFIDAEEFNDSPSANAFRSLARQTNGNFFSFSRNETFPDLSLYFLPMRHMYEVTYTSSITDSGEHTLGFYIETPYGTIPALDKTFTVDVEPPNPILVSPPLQITRQPPADDPYNAEVLEPSQQSIKIIVEFPDGHPRDLVRTALYVDGQVVAENTEAPFEEFQWDISSYTESGQHHIVAEAEDELGLKKSSIAIPITVTVANPPSGLEAFIGEYSSFLVLGSILFAGTALLIVLMRSRLRNVPETKRRKKRKAQEDPLTQPVPALNEPTVPASKKVKSQPRFGWMGPKQNRVPLAPAYLIRLTSAGEPASGTPIPILEKDMTFGTNPVQSMHVLDDPSISPLHARIKKGSDGSFMIFDQGSVAGTWVNFEAVGRDGIRLRHGDRIHLGQMQYRFDLHQPPAESEPKILQQK